MNPELESAILSHPFFHGMRPEHLKLAALKATEQTFKPGELLFSEGEPANTFYLIQTGRIALEARGDDGMVVLVEAIGLGEALGWSWLFPPYAWLFRARALEPVKAIVLNGGHLLATAESDHDFGYELMKRVAKLAIHRLQATRRQLLARQAGT